MKKNLLKWAIIFHAIMYSVSLLYIGYKYGVTSLLPYPLGIELFVFPTADIILFIIGLSLFNNQEYGKSKSYLKMGIITLAFGGWKLGSRLFLYYQGMGSGTTEYLDYILYPSVASGLYFIISIFYFLCTIITWKEDRGTY
ncbi:MAG: hypothetical protein IJA45_00480 [Oscillospiraceae bacterium]|nr:hypothetical protein [Oscillospiraceae bacterium]